ncbi:MAG: SSU ribosomal protein S7p (S5e), partial [uncultured Gemmatimonadaceae bacterium]
EPPQACSEAHHPPGCALRQPDCLEVHQRADAPGEEVHRGAHLLRRDGPRRGARRAARRERLQAGAQQPQAGGRGEEPPRGRRHLPGAGRGAPRSPHGARDALAHQLLARSRREVDGRQARRRGARRLAWRGQRDEEEGRHAPHGRSEQGVRALPLV